MAAKELLRADGAVTMQIGSEFYRVECEEELVFLTHPRWSLLGCGPDLPAAISDLLKEAAGVVDALAGRPAHELSERTHEMFRFAQDLVARGVLKVAV